MNIYAHMDLKRGVSDSERLKVIRYSFLDQMVMLESCSTIQLSNAIRDLPDYYEEYPIYHKSLKDILLLSLNN